MFEGFKFEYVDVRDAARTARRRRATGVSRAIIRSVACRAPMVRRRRHRRRSRQERRPRTSPFWRLSDGALMEPVGAENPDSSGHRSQTAGDPLIPQSRRPLWTPRDLVSARASNKKDGDVARRGYAASRYSWIRPPSRSRRRTQSRSTTSAIACSSLAGGDLPSGGCCPSARCGRCSL